MKTPHENVVCLANALSPVKMQVLDIIYFKSSKGKCKSSNYQVQNYVWYDWVNYIIQYYEQREIIALHNLHIIIDTL